jgi:iron complex outermembrane receptor protein
MSISLDANNLNNPVRHTYQLTENAPTNWYVSGRQYYLNLRMKM